MSDLPLMIEERLPEVIISDILTLTIFADTSQPLSTDVPPTFTICPQPNFIHFEDIDSKAEDEARMKWRGTFASWGLEKAPRLAEIVQSYSDRPEWSTKNWWILRDVVRNAFAKEYEIGGKTFTIRTVNVREGSAYDAHEFLKDRAGGTEGVGSIAHEVIASFRSFLGRV